VAPGALAVAHVRAWIDNPAGPFAQRSEAGRALLRRAWPILLALMALLLLVYSEI
jgi:hypothetical protein